MHLQNVRDFDIIAFFFYIPLGIPLVKDRLGSQSDQPAGDEPDKKFSFYSTAIGLQKNTLE